MLMNNLAVLLQTKGNLAEAETLFRFREALDVKREELRTRHPDTLISINNLAAVLVQKNGKLAEAEALFRELLEAKRDINGMRHPDTLMSIDNLASVLMQDEGNLDEVELLFRETLEAKRDMHGTQHTDTLKSISNLAAVLLRDSGNGRLGEVELLFREALAAKRAMLGARDPDTLFAINDLAMLLQKADKLDEAETLCREALETRRAVLGMRHPDTLTSINNLVKLRRLLITNPARLLQPSSELDEGSVEGKMVRPATLTELIGPPPEGVAPLDQFREALQLVNEADGRPPNEDILKHTSAEVVWDLWHIRYEAGKGRDHEKSIRRMVRGGWVESDAVGVELGLHFVSSGIGLAVRERRTVAAAMCHGVYASIARMGEHMGSPAPDIFVQALRLFDCEPSVAAFARNSKVQSADDPITLFAPFALRDEPHRITDCGVLVRDDSGYHVAPGDVVCIRSVANSLPYCHTAAMVIEMADTPEYALPPNTQLHFKEILVSPWNATFRRWHRYDDGTGVIFIDRRETVYDSARNIHIPTIYRQINLRGRVRYIPITPNHHRFNQVVNTIKYSPYATFQRTVTGCRCIVLTVAYRMTGDQLHTGPSTIEPIDAGSSVVASLSAAARGSRGSATVAAAPSANAFRVLALAYGAYRANKVQRVAAELRSKVEAAEAAAVLLLAGEEAEKAAESSKKAKSRKKKQRQKQQKGIGSPAQSPSRGAHVAGLDKDDTEAGVEEASTLSARRLMEHEAPITAGAVAAEQERQMAMVRAAADDPPKVIAIHAAELEQVLNAVGANGEVGEGGFGKVFAAELPSLPGWGRVAIKLATNMNPSALLQEVQLLRECRHSNVLPLLGFCGDTCAPCMVTPLMRGGSLDDRLFPSPESSQRLLRIGFSGDRHLSWQQRLSAMCDATRGLVHLHASRTLHRDVKTGNILLDGSLQPLQTQGGIIRVYRAFLSDVGLAKVRETSKGGDAMTHSTTNSVAFSTGFCDPIFINSNQHSERTDAYGIGVSLLMILLSEPASGLLTKWEDECIADFVEGDDGAVLDRLVAKAVAVASWPRSVTCGLIRVVHGLSVARKSRRQPLPDALDAMEALLQAGGGAAQLPEPAPARAMVREEGRDGTNGRSGGLTRLVGELDRLAVKFGGDAIIMRMQKHVNAAFLSMMTRLEAKHAQQGHAPLTGELSEHNKINALAPRNAFPKLNSHAHTLRIWWNAAKHDRGRWVDLPSDREAEEVAQGVMSELARLGW